MGKIFADGNDDVAGNIAKEMKADVEKFRERMWMIELLTTEAMTKKTSHWKDVFIDCGKTFIEPNDEMSLAVLIDA